jgi:hypothetical protein
MKSWKTLFLSMASAVSLGCLLAGCEPSNASTVPGSDSTVQRVIASQIPSLGAATPFAAFGGGAGITNQGVNTVVNGGHRDHGGIHHDHRLPQRQFQFWGNPVEHRGGETVW